MIAAASNPPKIYGGSNHCKTFYTYFRNIIPECPSEPGIPSSRKRDGLDYFLKYEMADF